ncbi:MAG: GNAT family N-acetyltransferase [Butyrivibrio sp.]|nr:GNAT family N-acetyltransferase [Acetatifactor muris]MCM1560114.1 GNAT family N-acetyltransferase [Butyrivibrio sp.]
MAFSFSDSFDELENTRLKLKVIAKDPGNEKEIPFYWYEILRKPDMTPIGKVSIRIGHNYHSYYNGNIGYEIDDGFRGCHYAREAAETVLTVAGYHGMKKVYLTCEEDNIASYRTIESLGARLVETAVIPEDYFGWYDGIPRYRIYEMEIGTGSTPDF